MAGLTKLEQETIISFNAAENLANIYSTNPTWMRKLEKLGGKQKGVGVEVDIPKGWLKIQKPRTLSEETRALYRAQAARARKKRAL